MFFNAADKVINNYLTKAEFGIEREGLRVSQDGSLAQTPHPFEADKNIDRDFCENQIELIGDVFTDPEQVTEQLLSLQRRVNSKLIENGELLWPFSNPPRISREDEIPVAEYSGTLQSKSVYRHYLAQKYGKTKMLFSGIHLNFSFTEQLLKEAFSSVNNESFTEFKNSVYLTLAQRVIQYAWLVAYLMASSPVSDSSIGTDSNVYSSIRCSEKGYWNHFTPILEYNSLKSYIASIQRYIDDGNLRSVSELYYPVRLKPRGENSLEALSAKGINHLELRVIDVNPLSPTGIFARDIRFIHILMIYLILLPPQDFNGKDQIKAVKDVKAAAVYGNEEIRQSARSILAEIKCFADKYFPAFSSSVEHQLGKTEPGCSYAEIISKRFGDDYMNSGLELAREYQRSVGHV